MINHNFYIYLLLQGIPQQPGTGQIAHLIAYLFIFFPSTFDFKNENVNVKVKYGFDLYTG